MRRSAAARACCSRSPAAARRPSRPATRPPRQEPFTVLLDYFPNADHAGIYAAQAAGLYAQGRAGREDPGAAGPVGAAEAAAAPAAPTWRSPTSPSCCSRATQGAENLVSRRRARAGAADVADGAAGGGHHAPADLAGKRVGTAGIPYQCAYLKTILAKAGVDPARSRRSTSASTSCPAMLSKKADATLGAFWNYEGVDLQRRKRKPVILRMEKLGVPTYNELIIVARREDLDAAGASRLRRFLQATAAGAPAAARRTRRPASTRC